MIVLGCDVGKATGLTLLDCSGSTPRFRETHVVRDDLTGVLDRLLGRVQIDLAAIETPSQVFQYGRAAENEGTRRAIEMALLVARDAAGVCRAIVSLRAPRAKLHEGQAHHVRRAVLGKLPKDHLDRFIASRLPLLVTGWPKVSNTHERDAAIVALWAWQRARAGIEPGDMPKAAKRAKKRGQRAGVEMLPVGKNVTKRDPGEDAPARDLADCSTCGARAGVACRRVGAEKLVHGVHEGRARAAGVHRDAKPSNKTSVCARCNGHQIEPGSDPAARTPCGLCSGVGVRRAATVPGEPRLVPRPCYVRLPWSTKEVRDERLDRRDRDVQRYRVPAEHREKWGTEVLLTRERAEDAEHGVYWLYSWKGNQDA